MTSPTTPSSEPTLLPGKRVVFMGTPEFSATILEHLIRQQVSVVAVYTQPDKPVGRKQLLEASPVKRFAEQVNIPVEQPARWDAETIDHLGSYRPDLILVAAYGKILPQAVLEIPQHGCVNIHTSLLPRWRGASPVHNAILAGDTTTGVTLMLMDFGMDTGALLAQAKLSLDGTETTPTLLKSLVTLALPLLDQTLPRWIDGSITPQPQDSSRATLCQLIDREDGRIFWNESVEVLERKYRALTPWPGLFFFWQRHQKAESILRIKLLEARFRKQELLVEPRRPLGMAFLLSDENILAIQCDGGVVIPTAVQIEGKKPISVKEFLSGYPDCLDTHFS